MYLTKSNSILTSGPERNIRNQKYQYKVINLTSINNISPTFSLSSDLFIDNLLLPFQLFAHYRIHFEGVLSSFLLPTCHDMNAWFPCLCVGAGPWPAHHLVTLVTRARTPELCPDVSSDRRGRGDCNERRDTSVMSVPVSDVRS